MSLSIVKSDSIWLKYTEGWNTQKVPWLYNDLYYVNMQSTFLKWWFKTVILVSDLVCPPSQANPRNCKAVSLTLAFLSFLSCFLLQFTLWEKGGHIFHIFLGHFKSHQYLSAEQGFEVVQNNFLFIFLSCPSCYWPSFNSSLWWYLTLSLPCFSGWFLAF